MIRKRGSNGGAERRRGRSLAVGALALAVLLSGLVVSVAAAAGSGITDPTVIALSSVGATERNSRTYPLRDADGKRSGSISVYREPLLDADDNPVGNVRTECFGAGHVVSSCSSIVILHAGPHTEDGSVVFTGLFRGFNGEALAVTGGTGAYENVRGYATLTVEGELFIRTLYLIP